MANSRIKGITIEIDGSTTGLQSALKDVDKQASKTASELQEINRGLKFDDSNATLLAQKFEVLQEAITTTSQRLDVLKKAQADVEAQFARGEISAEQYRAFQREIQKTEGILNGFKRQSDDIKAKIEVKADTSAIEKMKRKINELPAEAKQAGREIGQNLAAGAAAATAGLGALTIGMDDTNKQLSRLESQAAAATSSVNKLGANTKKMSDADLANFGESLSIKEGQLEASLDSQLSAVEKNYDAQRDALEQKLDREYAAVEKKLAKEEIVLQKNLDKQYDKAVAVYDKQLSELEKSLDKELQAYEKAADEKIKLIDKEYTERLKLVDEERYKQIKAIDDQIAGINKAQEADDKRQQAKEDADKRNDLRARIANAKDLQSRQEAQKALSDFEAQLVARQTKEKRRELIDGLKGERDAVNESYDKQKEAIKAQFDERKLQAKETIDVEKAALIERQKAEKQSFIDTNKAKLERLKESQDAELEALRAINEQRLSNLKVEQEQRKKALDNRLSADLKAVQDAHNAELESFRKMNAKKLKDAEKPITVPVQPKLESAGLTVDDFKDSRVIFDSVRQDVDQVSEAIGNLTQAGYDSGKEITAVSKSIAGAIQLYGDTFNAEGLAESIATTTNLGETTGQLTDLLEKSGITAEQFNAQLQQYSTVGERANFISNLLAKEGLSETYDNFAKLNPEIVGASKSQVELIDAMSDFTTTLRPVITAIQEFITSIVEWANENPTVTKGILAFVAVIGAIGAALAVVGPIFAGISAIATAFGVTIGAVAAPIGIAIVAIGALIAIITALVANWDGIGKFFTELWNGIKTTFTTVIGAIINFVKNNWQTILLMLTGPFGIAIRLIRDNWDVIKRVFTEKITAIKTFVQSAWVGLKDLLVNPVVSIKDKVTSTFELMVTKIRSIFENLKTFIKAPINEVIKLINQFIGGANKLKLPKWIPGVGGQGVSIPEIPMLAKGTNYFRGGTALVGEQGPELVTMPTGAKVTPNGKTMDMLGGDNININISSLVVREEADIKRIAKELYNLQQSKNRGGGRV